MILFLDIVSVLIQFANNCIFYLVLKTLTPMCGNRFVRLLAFVCLFNISGIIIYPHDVLNVWGVLAGFLLFMAVYTQGDLIPKLSVAVILYPMLVSLNFLTHYVGRQAFFALPVHHMEDTELFSTLTYIVSLAVRPFLWLAIWRIIKHLKSVIALLNTKMWILLDSICAAVLCSLLVVLNYLTVEEAIVAYPVAPPVWLR